jgi:uncharacterized protein (DUF433 family)
MAGEIALFSPESAYTSAMSTRTQHPVIDWSECDLVEVNPLKVSGVPILKHTRVQADSIVENYLSGSPVEEIAENFRVAPDVIRKVLAFAKLQLPQLQL